MAVLGVLIAATLACFCARVYLKRLQLSALTSAELAPKQGGVHPPVVEDCSSLHKAYKSVTKSRYRNKLPLTKAASLSGDEVAIYRIVLQQWVAGESSPLKVATETYPLDPFSDAESISCECLKSFEAEGLAAVLHSFHSLTRTVLVRKNMRLVNDDEPETSTPDPDSDVHRTPEEIASADFANGVFSLSEIVFDREHMHALVSYSFQCGMLCGSGRTILFEKVNGEWQETKVECGGWES